MSGMRDFLMILLGKSFRSVSVRPQDVSGELNEPDEMSSRGLAEGLQDRILLGQMLQMNSLVLPHRTIFTE